MGWAASATFSSPASLAICFGLRAEQVLGRPYKAGLRAAAARHRSSPGAGWPSIPSLPGHIGRAAGEQAAAWMRWHPSHARRMDRLLGSPFPKERVGHAAVEEPLGSWGKRGRPVPAAAGVETADPQRSRWQAAACR